MFADKIAVLYGCELPSGANNASHDFITSLFAGLLWWYPYVIIREGDLRSNDIDMITFSDKMSIATIIAKIKYGWDVNMNLGKLYHDIWTIKYCLVCHVSTLF